MAPVKDDMLRRRRVPQPFWPRHCSGPLPLFPTTEEEAQYSRPVRVEFVVDKMAPGNGFYSSHLFHSLTLGSGNTLVGLQAHLFKT
jgi:hypothetical protein